jgi:gliding motility-associated-like protein
MKKTIILTGLFLQTVFTTWGQGEQNIWAFGDLAGLDFNATAPVPYTTNLQPGYEGSAAICSGTGQLLFYTNGFWVWNRDHQIMPELTGGVGGYTAPMAPIGYPPLMNWNGGYATQATAVAGYPAHPGYYYVFSLSTSGNLLYALVDMSLNGGKGGIVAGKKGISIGTNFAEKLTVVKGCNSIWVVARSRTANQYKAYEINDTGIVTTPVISSVGNLPLSWYRCGTIKYSADGSKMAAACNAGVSVNNGGLELYDFDTRSGILSNARVLDSSSNFGYYYGTCFSPDNGKLYASTSSFGYAGTLYPGKVRQYDVSLATTAAITASNTIVYTDYSTSLDCMGDLQRGRNGKIYFSRGKSSAAINAINFPNLAGTACNAIANAIILTSGYAERGMPNDIAIIAAPDTVKTVKQVTICFRNTAVLVADTGKHYLWDNGSTSRQRYINSNGTYVVRYINMDCKYQTDSFRVRFIALPTLSASAYSCPGAKQAKAWTQPEAGDTTTFIYTWKGANGMVVQQHWSNSGDTLKAVDTGLYAVQVTTSTGCDTTLYTMVQPLPLPQASFTADSIACKGAPVAFISTSTAPLWKWYFGDGNFSNLQNPSYSYGQKGSFTASLVVINIEGCSDTATKEIEVKGLELNLSADKELCNKGEIVHLQSSGSEPYTVTAWEPQFLFPDQAAMSQTVAMDTTRTFIVTGISAYGCIAKAPVTVAVNPLVFMPNGFTPNGDGLNDRFRPVSTGYIFVRYFEIYNRYGQNVYKATGKSALEGWDGTFNGQLQDLGTYYYHINIETKEGGTIALKGDVILLR